MGGLVAGGGALLGSGAFTSTTASRSVDVNVIGDGLDGDGDGVFTDLTESEEQNLAESITESGADVLVDTSSSTVSVTDSTGSSVTATNAFPSNAATYADEEPIGTDHVSLVANDVTIVFGAGDGLPPNSAVNYGELLAFVGNTNGNDLQARFNASDTSESVLSEVNGTSLDDGTDNDDTDDPTVTLAGVSVDSTIDYSSGASTTVTKTTAPGTVDTTTSSSTGQTLDIIIESQ